jgi:hypothetical protein
VLRELAPARASLRSRCRCQQSGEEWSPFAAGDLGDGPASSSDAGVATVMPLIYILWSAEADGGGGGGAATAPTDGVDDGALGPPGALIACMFKG